MAYPPNGPATLAAVKTHLQVKTIDEDALIEPVVAAVNTRVLSWPVASVADGAADWTGPDVQHIVHGAVMLAARIHRRRNSPDGVAAFGSAGPIYVQRHDPDIAMLLQLGVHKKPKAR